MVCSLKQIALRKLRLRRADPAAHIRVFQNGIDLVECHPIFHFSAIVQKDRAGIAEEAVYQLPAAPAVIGACKEERRFVV